MTTPTPLSDEEIAEYARDAADPEAVGFSLKAARRLLATIAAMKAEVTEERRVQGILLRQRDKATQQRDAAIAERDAAVNLIDRIDDILAHEVFFEDHVEHIFTGHAEDVPSWLRRYADTLTRIEAEVDAFNEPRVTAMEARSIASDGGESDATPRGCKRCGKPLPTPSHIFCGAACCARWEAEDRSDGGEGRG